MGHRLLILQQTEWQPPGRFLLQAAQALHVDLQVTKIWRESAADFIDFDGLILLGGPFFIDQDRQHPFLREEKRLLQAWLHLNRPCLGFNLGMHLIAEAAGATLGPGYVRSTGFIDGHLTQEGRQHPLFLGIDSPQPLFKWHTQAIQTPLPRNLVLLATSRDCMVEACCLAGRPHIVGLQCDNHAAAPEDVAAWVAHDRSMLATGKKRQPAARDLVEAARQAAHRTETTLIQLMRNFIELLHGQHPLAP